MLEFLKEGRPVRVAVSLTVHAWSQEEPARREVFATIVRKVRVCVFGEGGGDARARLRAHACVCERTRALVAAPLALMMAPFIVAQHMLGGGGSSGTAGRDAPRV